MKRFSLAPGSRSSGVYIALKPLTEAMLATLLTGFLGYGFLAHFAELQRRATARDSVAYWAAARLLINRQNPYDYDTVLDIERKQGYGANKPLVLRTPPWSLFLIVALGLIAPIWAWFTWLVMSIACLVLGMRVCRKLYDDQNSVPQPLFSLVGYTFAPIPACLVSGQMGLVLMLGLVLFLWWEARRPFLAGAALILPFAKPHLLSLFWLVLLLWGIVGKKREIALGFAASFAVVTAIAMFFDPQIFQHYRQMLHTASIENEFIPALSGMIRLLFFRRFFWVQFIPMILALIWCLGFAYPRLSVWNWREHGPALFVVSVLTTPYTWLADESILLPAIMQATVFAYHARGTMKCHSEIALLLIAALNGLLLLILRFKIPFATGIYFWSSLVWFVFYFYSHRLQEHALRLRLRTSATT
jgi:hypothetical protein